MYTRWSPELTKLTDAASGARTIKLDSLDYRVFAGPYQEALASIAPQIDDIIEKGNLQKHSKKSTASLFKVGADVFFGKHVHFHQKAFGLRFRYFIQPSRSFFWRSDIALAEREQIMRKGSKKLEQEFRESSDSIYANIKNQARLKAKNWFYAILKDWGYDQINIQIK